MKKLAVLIDADNIGAAEAAAIFGRATRLGEPITRRAYGNLAVFSGKTGWKEPVRQYAIEARPQVSNVDRKNTADFALILDAMDFLATGRYDGFVLVSGDSDFTSLAQRLRNEDKAVYGMGNANAPASFRSACTEFFELGAKKAAAKPSPAPSPAASKTAPPQTEFLQIAAKLRKQGCRKAATLRNTLVKSLKKPPEEAEKIIAAMKTRKLIALDDNGKVTWPDQPPDAAPSDAGRSPKAP